MKWRSFVQRASSVCFLLAGCQALGPVALGAGRGAHNDVISRTNSEQTLSLLVRLRYADPISLLTVSSITAGLKFNVEAKGEVGFGQHPNYVGDLVPLSAAVGYEDSPTISYTPVDGEAFLREWLAPVTLETLALVLQAAEHRRRAHDTPSRTHEWTAQVPAEERTAFQRAATLLAELRDVGVAA